MISLDLPCDHAILPSGEHLDVRSRATASVEGAPPQPSYVLWSRREENILPLGYDDSGREVYGTPHLSVVREALARRVSGQSPQYGLSQP